MIFGDKRGSAVLTWRSAEPRRISDLQWRCLRCLRCLLGSWDREGMLKIQVFFAMPKKCQHPPRTVSCLSFNCRVVSQIYETTKILFQITWVVRPFPTHPWGDRITRLLVFFVLPFKWDHPYHKKKALQIKRMIKPGIRKELLFLS